MNHQRNDIIDKHQAAINEKVALKQLQILYGTSKRGLSSTWLYSTVLLFALYGVVSTPTTVAWYGIMVVVILLRYLLTRAYYQAEPCFEDIARWRNGFTAGAAATGLLWGISGTLLFPLDNPPYQLLVGFVIIGMISTAVAYLSIIPMAYISYMLLAMVPFSVSMFFYGMPYVLLGIIMLPYMVILVLTSLSLSREPTTSLYRAFENQVLAEQLAIEFNRAEQASQAKSEFLSRMSHELRTPMNAVMGFAQLLELSVESKEKKQYVGHILSGADHLLELINGLLDLSRIESGKVEMVIEDHSLSALIHDCLTLLAPLIDKQKIDLSNATVDQMIRVDENCFRQALLNLISNAIKYSQRGGRILMTSETLHDGLLRVSIIDGGIGIPEENLKTIFESFDRGAVDHNTIEGTGIGLSISKTLIEQMGGKIGVDSEENKGSTFWVEIPLSKISQSDMPEMQYAG